MTSRAGQYDVGMPCATWQYSPLMTSLITGGSARHDLSDYVHQPAPPRPR